METILVENSNVEPVVVKNSPLLEFIETYVIDENNNPVISESGAFVVAGTDSGVELLLASQVDALLLVESLIDKELLELSNIAQ